MFAWAVLNPQIFSGLSAVGFDSGAGGGVGGIGISLSTSGAVSTGPFPSRAQTGQGVNVFLPL